MPHYRVGPVLRTLPVEQARAHRGGDVLPRGQWASTPVRHRCVPTYLRCLLPSPPGLQNMSTSAACLDLWSVCAENQTSVDMVDVISMAEPAVTFSSPFMAGVNLFVRHLIMSSDFLWWPLGSVLLFHPFDLPVLLDVCAWRCRLVRTFRYRRCLAAALYPALHTHTGTCLGVVIAQRRGAAERRNEVAKRKASESVNLENRTAACRGACRATACARTCCLLPLLRLPRRGNVLPVFYANKRAYEMFDNGFACLI